MSRVPSNEAWSQKHSIRLPSLEAMLKAILHPSVPSDNKILGEELCAAQDQEILATLKPVGNP